MASNTNTRGGKKSKRGHWEKKVSMNLTTAGGNILTRQFHELMSPPVTQQLIGPQPPTVPNALTLASRKYHAVSKDAALC